MAITFNHNDKFYVSGSNVGIGTDSPQRELHIKGDTWAEMRLEGRTFAGGHGATLEFYSEGTALADIYANTSKDLILRTNGGNEKLRILANGNVGIGTTDPAGKLHVYGGRSFFAPADDGGSGVDSQVIDIYNPHDTVFTADARTAYNAHTSWNINSRSTYTISSRPKSGSIYTFAGENASSPVAINRYVQFDSSNDNPLLNWTFYQWDGSGTAATDLKVPSKVWTVQSYQSGGSDTLLILSGDGSLQLSQYGAGVLTTDASGNITASTAYQTQSTADGRYVNVTGDTMTGQLVIQKTGNFTAAKFKGTAADGYGQITVENDLGTSLILGSMGSTKTGTFFDNARYIGATSGELVLKTYSSTDGHMKFLSGGQNERMRITAGGNVGIGTTNPSYKLDVDGAVRATSGGAYGLRVHSNSGITASNNYMNFFTSQSNGWAFNANGTGADSDTKVIITAGGKVGIGITNPGSKLTVSGSAISISNGWTGTHDILFVGGSPNSTGAANQTAARIRSTASAPGGAATGDLLFTVNSGDTFVDALYIEETGNVGIGTTAPTARLSVTGVTSTTEPTMKIQSGTSNVYGMMTTYDAYHGFIMRGIPAAATTYGVNAGDQMSFFEYGGQFRFYEKNNTGAGVLNEIVRLDKSNSFFTSNVGIGTTSPDGKLNISASYTSSATITNDASDYAINVDFLGTNGSIASPQYGAHFAIRDSNGAAVAAINGVDQGASGATGLSFLTGDVNGLSDRLHITYTGNVGIGTTSPSAKLDVRGYVTFQQPSGSQVTQFLDSTGDGLKITAWDNGANIDPAVANDNLYFGRDVTMSNFIVQSGNVGIGTTSPQDKLHVAGAVRGDFKIEGGYSVSTTDVAKFTFGYTPRGGDTNNKNIAFISAYNTTTDSTSGGYLSIGTRATNGSLSEHIRIAQDGNVGIGTTNPDAKLKLVNSSETNPGLTICNAAGGGTGFLFQRWQYVEANTGYRLDLKQKVTSGVVRYAFDMVNNGTSYVNNLVLDRGNVGIGIETPGAKLDVNSGISTSSTDVIKLSQATNGDVKAAASLGLSIQNGGESTNAADLWFTTASGGSLSERMRITSGGNVGIGTASPGYGLTVSNPSTSNTGTMYVDAVLNSSGKGLVINSTTRTTNDNSVLAFEIINRAGGNTMSANVAGNVGIGTTSPASGYKLDVRGNILAYYANVVAQGLVSGYGLSEQRIGPDGTSATSKPFIVYTSGGFTNERLRIDTSGNVGIGNTNPSTKLAVAGTIQSSAGGAWASSAGYTQLTHDGSTTGYLSMYYDTETLVMGAGISQKNNITISGHSADNTIYFRVGNSERMRITSGGNVGIGTTAPQQALHIKGATNGLMMLEGDNDNGLAGCYYKTEDTDNTMNRTKGFFGFRGNHAYGLGYFTMWLDTVGDNGQVTSSEEKFRWERDGDFHADGDVIAYSTTTPSDIRLKTDIETIESASEKVSKLRGVEYTWSKGKLAGQREIGLIAQEVEAVVPEVVKEKELPLWDDSGESYKTVDYEKLVALLIESNKEMQEEIKQLKERLDGFTK